MNKFISRLLFVDSAVLIFLFTIFSLAIMSRSLILSYFGPFELYFLAFFLAIYILDRVNANSIGIEMYAFIVWAGLSGFELIRSIRLIGLLPHNGLLVLPPVFAAIKGLLFLGSAGLFYFFRFKDIKLEHSEKKDLGGNLLFQNLLLWGTIAFILGLLIAPLFNVPFSYET
jgi:hypothetical protein